MGKEVDEVAWRTGADREKMLENRTSECYNSIECSCAEKKLANEVTISL